MTAEETLIEEVKRYLNITWQDDDTESEVEEYIITAKNDLNEMVGTEIDYDEDIVARGLLKDHCRYQKNKDTEFFEENFSRKINRLRFKYAIQEDVTDSDESEEENSDE